MRNRTRKALPHHFCDGTTLGAPWGVESHLYALAEVPASVSDYNSQESAVNICILKSLPLPS